MIRAARILLLGYGLAAVAAAALAGAGGGVLGPLLMFWVGGALCVIVIAVATAPFLKPLEHVATPDDVSLEEALAEWEADRRADAPGPASRRDASA